MGKMSRRKERLVMKVTKIQLTMGCGALITKLNGNLIFGQISDDYTRFYR
jgi:hypothetical protein